MAGRRVWLVALVALLGVACGSDAITTSEQLEEALSRAKPGDVIHVEPGRFEGSFVVPGGVTVEGSGKGATILVATGSDPTLVLVPGTPAAAATDLTVELPASANTGAAVLAHGKGQAALRRVNVIAAEGVGVAAEDLDRLILQEVAINGVITEANATSYPTTVNVLEVSYAGLVTSRVTNVEMSDVDLNGFAEFGALFVKSDVTWNGGTSTGHLAVGVMVHDGSANLSGVTIAEIYQGFRLIWGYGLVIAAGAKVTTTGLRVREVSGVGILQDGAATSAHAGPHITSNRYVGVWLQGLAGTADALAFKLDGVGSLLHANGAGGVVAINSSGIEIADAEIDETLKLPTVVNETSQIWVGDGIHLVSSVVDVQLRDLYLDGNKRIGVLCDGGGQSLAGVRMENIVIVGTGEELGLLGQNGLIADGWSDGVTVMGAAAANDTNFGGGSLETLPAAASDRVPNAGKAGDNGLLGSNGLLFGLLGSNG